MICPFEIIEQLQARIDFLNEALAESEAAYAELQAEYAEAIRGDVIVATLITPSEQNTGECAECRGDCS